jgi:hypothetical protein
MNNSFSALVGAASQMRLRPVSGFRAELGLLLLVEFLEASLGTQVMNNNKKRSTGRPRTFIFLCWHNEPAVCRQLYRAEIAHKNVHSEENSKCFNFFCRS